MHSVDTVPKNLNALGTDNPISSLNLETPSTNESTTAAPTFVVVSFSSWLKEAQNEQDPFTALARKCHNVQQDVWTTRFSDDSGALIDCKLSLEAWDSTTFGTTRPETFRYIELFEETSKKRLVYIRMSHDHLDGEWLWINKGDTVSGQQAKALAEKISRAMRIHTCFLADSAKVPMGIGGDVQIRVPLQIMRGYGYYGPTFSLASTSSTKSAVEIFETKRTLWYKQNPKKHMDELMWLQNLKISYIQKTILSGKTASVQWLSKVKKSTQDLTLQEFIKELYSNKEAKTDYEWACVCLLTHTEIPTATPEQKRYQKALKMLFHNMLMSANFV